MRAVVSLLAILVVLALLAGCTASAATHWTYAPATPGPAVAGAGTGAAGAPSASPATAAAASPAGTIDVKAFDLGFTPNQLTVPTPGRYAVTLTNTGQIPHDITFASGETAQAPAGGSATVDVDVPAGGLSFICSIPGHEQAGMHGTVAVAGATAAGSAAPSAGTSPAPSPAADSHGGPMPTSDVAADPNAPAPVTYDATAPTRLPGTVHDVDLVITETTMTVAPGFVQAVWTFGGTVPGPVIRVKVGDTIRVHLKNPATDKLPHSIDFHASQVAWNDEMTSINPGQEKLYEWTADYAGVWMYHCGTSPALHHIANGMYGMVIVEPAEAFSRFVIWPCGPRYHSLWTRANSLSTLGSPSLGSTMTMPYMPLAMWWRAGDVPQWYIQTPAYSAVHS